MDCFVLGAALRPQEEGKQKGRQANLCIVSAQAEIVVRQISNYSGEEEYRGFNSTTLWHKSELC